MRTGQRSCHTARGPRHVRIREVGCDSPHGVAQFRESPPCLGPPRGARTGSAHCPGARYSGPWGHLEPVWKVGERLMHREVPSEPFIGWLERDRPFHHATSSHAHFPQGRSVAASSPTPKRSSYWSTGKPRRCVGLAGEGERANAEHHARTCWLEPGPPPRVWVPSPSAGARWHPSMSFYPWVAAVRRGFAAVPSNTTPG